MQPTEGSPLLVEISKKTKYKKQCLSFAEAIESRDERASGIYVQINEGMSIKTHDQEVAKIDFMLIYIIMNSQLLEGNDPYSLILSPRVGRRCRNDRCSTEKRA